jgi:hypothetical protein
MFGASPLDNFRNGGSSPSRHFHIERAIRFNSSFNLGEQLAQKVNGDRGSSEGMNSQAGILADALEQFAHVNLQGMGELHDIFNPEVPFAAFNPTNVCGVQPRFFGKFFLRPFLLQS